MSRASEEEWSGYACCEFCERLLGGEIAMLDWWLYERDTEAAYYDARSPSRPQEGTRDE